MKTELVQYSVGGDAFDAFVAYPDGAGPHPAVLVCHAWGGRDDFAEDKAKQLAKLGYVGVAIDVYGVGVRGTDTASCQALMEPLLNEPETLRARLAAANATATGLADVDANKIAVIGYCFGGLCSILMSRMGLPLAGVVSFHGLLKIGAKLETKASAPMLVLHGQDDPMGPPSDVGAFAEEMKRIDADWQLHAFPGVMHAFTNPAANDPSFGTVYNEDADKRSWIAMKRFLTDVFG